MHRLALATLAALVGGTAAAHAAPQDQGTTLDAVPVEVAVRSEPGIPELPQQTLFPDDPADSLYRAARAALNRREFRRAAQLFRQIPSSYPRSAYVPDALYWEAFALYRVGSGDDLKRALALLDKQAGSFPRASTRRDADALATRIRGTLAQSGDADAAARVARDAARTTGEVAAAVRVAAAAPAPRAAPSPGSAPVVAQGCAGEENDNRLAALNALLQMDPQRALPMLKQVLARRDACSRPLREQAVFLLAQHRTPEAEATLLQLARSDPDPEVRGKAVFWLSQVSSESSLELLEEIIRGADEGEIRKQAIFALSQHRSERASGLLRAIAERDDYPAETRAEAIFWLGQRGAGVGAEYLRALYPRLGSEELKGKLIFSVSQTPGQERWLMELAGNERESEEMRKQAIFWASQSRAVSVTELTALYDRLPTGELRQQVIFGLGQRDQDAAVEKLISIARTDRDPEMRRHALFWLGQSDDPRATEAIVDALRAP